MTIEIMGKTNKVLFLKNKNKVIAFGQLKSILEIQKMRAGPVNILVLLVQSRITLTMVQQISYYYYYSKSDNHI